MRGLLDKARKQVQAQSSHTGGAGSGAQADPAAVVAGSGLAGSHVSNEQEAATAAAQVPTAAAAVGSLGSPGHVQRLVPLANILARSPGGVLLHLVSAHLMLYCS